MSTHLLRGHDRFQTDYAIRERQYLKGLAAGQSPSALYISCSDSRVVPELLTGSRPGDLFVVRNVANVVPRADEPGTKSVGASVEFAVNVLKVPHIVVCGHYGCGGINAALEGLDKLEGMSCLQEWLTRVEPAALKAKAAGIAADELLGYAIEENVLDQMLNLMTYPCVREGVEAGTLDIHAWVYDFTGGLVVYDAPSRNFVSYKSQLERDSARDVAG